MKFYEWNNKMIGNFDIFAEMNEIEKDIIVSHYNTLSAESVSIPETDKYYYFISSTGKIITPLPMLSLAFGGMYNGYPPYGEEITDFKFDITEYELALYKEDKW